MNLSLKRLPQLKHLSYKIKFYKSTNITITILLKIFQSLQFCPIWKSKIWTYLKRTWTVLKVSVFSALPHSPTPCVYLHPMPLSPSHVFISIPCISSYASLFHFRIYPRILPSSGICLYCHLLVEICYSIAHHFLFA